MLENKVVVITGGAGLLGQSFVQAVYAAGGCAVIADVDQASAEKICGEYEDKERIDSVYLDVTREETIKQAIQDLVKRHGKINALVNNAYPRNKQYGADFFNVNFNDFNDNININLGGLFLSSQIFAQYFQRESEGNIINISSIYGVVAPKFGIYEDTNMTMPVEYAVIKSAVLHLTKYMAKYFSGTKLRVNAISPGGIYNRQPENFIAKYNSSCLTKGMLNPEDLQGALIFLLSNMSEYINGQNIIVDDGFCL